MIVLDASAVLELLLGTPRGDLVKERIAADHVTLHAPELVDIEVLQGLRKYCALSLVRPARARIALDDLRALDMTRYPHAPMGDRIWQLRSNLTAYDAAYVALAEALSAPLLTFDGRMARAPGNKAEVESL